MPEQKHARNPQNGCLTCRAWYWLSYDARLAWEAEARVKKQPETAARLIREELERQRATLLEPDKGEARRQHHGECRARPPVIFSDSIDDGRPVAIGRWPETQADDWCMAWKARGRG